MNINVKSSEGFLTRPNHLNLLRPRKRVIIKSEKQILQERYNNSLSRYNYAFKFKLIFTSGKEMFFFNEDHMKDYLPYVNTRNLLKTGKAIKSDIISVEKLDQDAPVNKGRKPFRKYRVQHFEGIYNLSTLKVITSYFDTIHDIKTYFKSNVADISNALNTNTPLIKNNILSINFNRIYY